MRVKFKILIFLLAAFAVSCEKTSTETQATHDSLEVNFSAAVTSRATDTGFVTGDQISVSAYDVNDDLYVKNISYTYGSSLFSSSSPIEYKYEGSQLSFIALYPYTEISDSKNVSFSVKTDQNSGDNYTLSDLMLSSVEATTASTPQLTFDHILTKVIVNIVSSDVDVTNAQATLNALTTVNYNLSTLTSTTSGSASEITMASNGTNSYKAIIVPQAISSNVTLGSISVGSTNYEYCLSANINILAGKEYIINATIKDGLVTFDVPIIKDWLDDGSSDGSSENVEGNIYTNGTWEVIDYYSADGTSGTTDALFDNSLNTYWTTTSTSQQWVTIDLKSNYIIKELLLSPRGDSYTGSAYSGTILTSIDNANWSSVGEYEFAANYEVQSFAVTPSVARYVKIHSTSSTIALSTFGIAGSYYGESDEYSTLSVDKSYVEVTSSSDLITITVTTNSDDNITYSIQEGYVAFKSVTDGVYTFSVSTVGAVDVITDYITFSCGHLTSQVVTIDISPSSTIANNTTFTIDSFSSEEDRLEGTSGFVSCLIDGDVSTYWHSEWSYGGSGGSISDPDYAVINLQAYYTITNVYITPRSGFSRQGSIYTSNDAETWVAQASYTTGTSLVATDIELTSQPRAKYVKITVTNGYAMLSEFNIAYSKVE